MAETDPKHPSPHRSRVRWWQQYVGLIGAPLAWIGLVSFDFTLADFGCGRLPGINLWTSAAGIACLAACAASGWVAFGVWRATQTEAHGSHGKAIDVGEGRSRFFAMTGMLASGIFTVATLATLFSTLVVPPC